MQNPVFSRVVVLATLVNGALLAATCESVSRLQLPYTTITKSSIVSAGAFTLPGSVGSASEVRLLLSKLPAFCRVEGVIRPTADSNIEWEVWMPVSGWNGKYLGIGNGGFAGSINYASGGENSPSMAQALVAGYATSSTDTGHQGSVTDANWAPGHGEKVIDYAYRAIHLTAVNAKSVVSAFYGTDAPKSYFSSCSNGGRQALMEAQRYPDDYTGIVAGDASWFSTHLSAAQIWNVQALTTNQNSVIGASKIPAISAAVLNQCDALDGVRDGVLETPTRCHFDTAALLCKAIESDNCLTGPQVEALKKIYSGPVDSQGKQIFPGILPGGETGPNGWGRWITGSESAKSLDYAFGVGGAAKLVFQNPSWDFRTFSFDRDVKVLDEKLGAVRNATDANLKSFKTRGGKLILYHGWSDADVSPLSTANYYQDVATRMGEASAREFIRVYIVPGLQHCVDGPGATVLGSVPNMAADPQRGIQAVLERWVESGAAPEEIIAAKYKVYGHPESGIARTHPICPYPKVARYKGSGSTDEAANFACVAERR